MRFLLKHTICLALFALGTISTSAAQAKPKEISGPLEWKSWSGVGMDVLLSRKAEISFNYLRSYDMRESVNYGFHQGGVMLDYDFTKTWGVKAGMAVIQSASSPKWVNRYFLRGSHMLTLGKNFKWTNSLQVEKHSKHEKRFDYRLIYIARLGLKKRLDFLRLSPSLSYWLYYNVGGEKIQYYVADGTRSIKQSPNGLHRGRWILNLNSKITESVSLSLYYLLQHEFNLFSAQRELHVVHPVSGKITRPFNSYNVIGITVSFNIN